MNLLISTMLALNDKTSKSTEKIKVSTFEQ